MNLSDYVDVPTRFAALLAKWPELRIKEHRPEIVTIGDKTSSVSRCRLGEHLTTLSHVKRLVLSRSPARHRSRVTASR
jgi:hypothetical protein